MKNQNQPEDKLALAAVQNTRNRQTESDLQNTDVMKDELSMKSGAAVAEVKETKGAEGKGTLKMKYQKATADSINKVNQDLATKAIEQRLRQEIDSEKMRRFQQQEPSQR